MENGNFRKAVTSSGKLMLAGKNAETNEKLIEQVGKEELVFHTAKPGSPFVNIKLEDGEKYSQKDVQEAAIFCAKYSQDWKKAKIKKDVDVHYFLGKDIFKLKDMKLGTFGVKGYKEMRVKKINIENFNEKNN